MVVLLLCGFYVVEEVAYAFNITDKYASTCVVEEATDPSSFVIVSFAARFSLSATLIIDSVKERILFVGGSDTTSNTTSRWVVEGLPGVLKIFISYIIIMYFSVDV